jgi:outer membrane lipoprotein-sorting protein
MYKFLLLVFVFCYINVNAQEQAMQLVQKVKAKLDVVNDYTAEGKMRTDVAFIKAPVGKVKVYYKKPNKFRLERNGGISILPKGGISINISSMIVVNGYMALDAGTALVGTTNTRVIKLLPNAENSDIILTTLYIDEANLVIRKSVTTTRENGTYEMEMFYGKFISYGLPDKVIFSFNTKDYKLPKGVTLELDDVDQATKEKMKGKKGKVEIIYANYAINSGLAESIFK